MKHQKQDMNKHEKHKHDYYLNPHVIKLMINMIAKQMVRTQNMGPYKHGCLKYYTCMS